MIALAAGGHPVVVHLHVTLTQPGMSELNTWGPPLLGVLLVGATTAIWRLANSLGRLTAKVERIESVVFPSFAPRAPAAASFEGGTARRDS